MKIALMGYGKMGKTIEAIALERGHEIILKITSANANETGKEELQKCDVVIEFTRPDLAVQNILKCFNAKVPVVTGTTGWYDHFDDIHKIALNENQSLFYASNFSIGVNIFFEVNKKLASLMNSQPGYDVEIEEIHHVQKLDAPSGTAITAAKGIIGNVERKNKWLLAETINEAVDRLSDVIIRAVREGDVKGTHTVIWKSDIDKIELKHEAFNRSGFALGAILAAEWLIGKKGVYSMSDMLNF